MNAACTVKTLACLAALFTAPMATAEIILKDGGGTAAAEPGYAFAHPAMGSVVFVSPEARQMAILPPGIVFVQPPPLLMRAPSLFPVYPPASPTHGLNSSSRPSNRDVVTYHLQRAHGFSQELFYRDTYLTFGTAPSISTSPYLYWNSGVMPAYPPAAPGSSRPSNRDNTTYNLERAHRYSMDAYKKP